MPQDISESTIISMAIEKVVFSNRIGEHVTMDGCLMTVQVRMNVDGQTVPIAVLGLMLNDTGTDGIHETTLVAGEPLHSDTSANEGPTDPDLH